MEDPGLGVDSGLGLHEGPIASNDARGSQSRVNKVRQRGAHQHLRKNSVVDEVLGVAYVAS